MDQAYQRDGVWFPIPVLSGAEVIRYRQACEGLEQQLGGRPRTVEVRQMHLHFGWAYQLATHPRVLAAVEKLLGPDLLIWATELFAKHPGDGVSIGWHRDFTYTGFDADLSTTAWIALTPSTCENGCMQVRAGSHATPCPHGAGDVSAEPAGKQIDAEKKLDVVLHPGQMSLHHGRLLHGSESNRSLREQRIGFVIRYVAPQARPLHGHPPVVVAQGEDRYGHFQLVPPPAADGEPTALDAMRRSAAHHLEAVLRNIDIQRFKRA